MRRTRTRAALLAALLLLGTAGCTAPAEVARAVPVRTPAAPPSQPPPSPVLAVVALGDSYTQGFSACGRPGDCPTHSWATGDAPEVDSLLQRLGRARGARTVGHNLSVSGARVGALARQAGRAAGTDADLVVVLVGVNDVCTGSVEEMTPPDVFARELGRGLSVLDEVQPATPLLLLSVPDLGRMGELGRDVPAARAVWDRHSICPPVFGPEADRAATDARRAAFDRALAVHCALRPRCTWDGGALGALRFGPDFLSPDWFHPSAAGQTQIADVAERALSGVTTGVGPTGVGPAGVEPALGRP